MREQVLIRALEMHDRAINHLAVEFKAMQKVLDKTYVQSLTHVMMWDCLMTLLDKQGIVTKLQFDQALKELSEQTKAAMEAEQNKKAETAEQVEANAGTVIKVLSDEPAIPVK